jgi:hypothetical protein
MSAPGDSSFGDISVTDSLSSFDRAASHPNPAFDFLTGFVPRKLKDLFKWCEYLFYNSAHTYAALRKFGELVITDIEIQTSNEALKRNYKRLFDKVLKVKMKLLMGSLDKNVYGNHFTSIYKPFIRYLKCPKCENLTNINMVDYQFELKKLQFRYRCKRCHTDVNGKVVDRKVLAADKIHIIRWDPKQMDIDHNPITGQSVYYYTIPQDIKDKVKLGAKHLINSMPYEFLENIRDNKLFRFEKDAIFHVKVPGPAGIDPQWGYPPLATTMKLYLYTMVLRKANEAIALEHIVPMRILHPAQHGAQDFAQQISLGRWQEEMKYNIRRWRRDPLHVMFAPVPVGVANMGGDGRAMLTLAEVQEAEKGIMAAHGVPEEFLYGGLTKAGMEGTLRLIENQLQGHADDMNDLLQWYIDQVSKFLGWERVNAKLTPLKMVDDTETKALVVQLATGQVGGQATVSMTTMMERLGLDPEEERDKRLQFALDEAKLQMKIQQEVQKLQNTLSQQVQAQLQGAQGLNYDQQAVIGQADQMVQQMMSLDENTKKSQLHSLQVEDYVMYSVVVQRLEEMQNAQRMQLQQAVKAQGGAPDQSGMPPQGV